MRRSKTSMQPPSTLPPLWFKDKQFTGRDDVSNKAAYWSEILEPLQNKSPNILLIGSGDGRSALFFLNYLPDSQLTCIGRFNGAHEARFDRNLSEFAPRVRKLKGHSFASLSALRQEDCQFDVIFIAARHQREAMLLDNALSWPMLRKGGILIWDYYRRHRSSKPRWRRPTSAIDGFLLAYRGEYEELFRGNEMIVRKTVATPALPGAMLRPAEPKRSVIGAFRSLLRPIQQLLPAVRRNDRPVSNEARRSPDQGIEHASDASIGAGLEDFNDNLAFVSALLRPLHERAVDDLLARGEAETKDFCEKIITHYRNGGRSTASVLTKLARKIDASALPNKTVLSQQLLEAVCGDHIKQQHLRKFVNYRMGESFTANMVKHVAAARSLKRERAKRTPEWFVNTKKKGHLVATHLGARVPETYCVGIASASIELKDDIVIKPTFGADSVGVFLVKDRSAMFDGASRNVFAGETELRKRIAALLASGKVKRDSWRIEELIRGKKSFAPIDVKFYCFYGRVAMVCEVQRLPERKFNWYNLNGELIRTGRYEDMEFESEGLRPEEVELAAKFSSEIPTPFLRIDFMRAENDDLVFCEFTPCPANFEEHNATIDLMMGREFTSAEARLRDDLLMGKSFSRFLEIYTGGHRTTTARQLLGA